MGGTWQLAGVLVGHGLFQDQPENAAVFGNYTAALDVATYRDLILAVIPEPSFGGWAGAAVLYGLFRRRRRA